MVHGQRWRYLVHRRKVDVLTCASTRIIKCTAYCVPISNVIIFQDLCHIEWKSYNNLQKKYFISSACYSLSEFYYRGPKGASMVFQAHTTLTCSVSRVDRPDPINKTTWPCVYPHKTRLSTSFNKLNRSMLLEIFKEYSIENKALISQSYAGHVSNFQTVNIICMWT